MISQQSFLQGSVIPSQGGGGQGGGPVSWGNILNKPDVATRSMINTLENKHNVELAALDGKIGLELAAYDAKLPQLTVNFDWPHIERKKSDGTKYIRNLETNNTGTVDWASRGNV